ncbi:MAG: hypothetical protein HZA19_04955 [Nitrospirae bacterium]|nr:hypothetical protein [Nitrospirota bacterium]
MDSYVVRLYRRDPKDLQSLAGVVERAGAKGQKAFRDLGGLMAILTGPPYNFALEGKKGRKGK